jgi:hypothetical protein
MAMWIERATFRVVTDNVQVLGVVLPQGEYNGYLEMLSIMMAGFEKQSIARAMIPLNRSDLVQLGANVSDGLLSVDCPVLSYLHSRDIVLVT